MYTLDEIRKEFEEGALDRALLKLRLFAFENRLKFPFKWASSELYGYTELLEETDETLPWWRDCLVVWISHDEKAIGSEYDPERDQAWVFNGVKDVEEQSKSGLPPGEFRIPPPDGKEDSILFGMVEIKPLYDRIREAGLHLLVDIEKMLRESTTEDSQEQLFSREQALQEVLGFKNLIERQAYKDIFVNGNPRENIARSLLQAYLPSRSYREVPVRRGKSDLLIFSKDGRFLYETKIWRGQDYHEQGLREIEEYILGEGDDENLLGIFYLIFDPTKSQSAREYFGNPVSVVNIAGHDVQVVVIDLAPEQPSKKK